MREKANVETKVVTCTICEHKCTMEIKMEEGEILEIAGNSCPKGAIQAAGEIR